MTRIRVLSSYVGVQTDGRVIKAGVYDADDPRLLGLAQYLVSHGRAVVVADVPDDEADTQAMPALTVDLPVTVEEGQKRAPVKPTRKRTKRG